jgi:hypothetical protein
MESAMFRKWLADQGCRVDTDQEKRGKGHENVTVHRDPAFKQGQVARGQDGISSRPSETNSSLPPQPGKPPAPRASPGTTNPHDRFTSGKIPANCDRPWQGSVRYPGYLAPGSLV